MLLNNQFSTVILKTTFLAQNIFNNCHHGKELELPSIPSHWWYPNQENSTQQLNFSLYSLTLFRRAVIKSSSPSRFMFPFWFLQPYLLFKMVFWRSSSYFLSSGPERKFCFKNVVIFAIPGRRKIFSTIKPQICVFKIESYLESLSFFFLSSME